jgi:2-C-methyl-D-erythritol 4-phosphate cytidylyltransferase
MTTALAKSPDSAAAPPATPRFFALIPCAGQGSRAGTAAPKQYQRLGGQVMVKHTVDAFRALGPALAGIWVVISPEDHEFETAFPDFGGPGEVLLPGGGPTRAASVLNGLKALLAQGQADRLDWALVHDAARCLITPAQIAGLISACEDDPVGGLLAQPLPDTLKSSTLGRAQATIGRSDKWLAQTPQMFRIGALITALEAAGDAVTDESSAIEASGLAPRLVAGSAQNFKVTFPEDFALAEAILQSRRTASLVSD